MNSHNESSLATLLNPRSVAILGASNTPTRIGGRSLSYMLQRRFDGRIFPVNPRRDRVQDVKSYASVSDLPEAPDVAIVALAASMVPGAIDDLIARGTKSAVVFSSGFSEIDEAGAKMQLDIAARAEAGGLRLLGPNTLGLFNSRINFWGTFTSTLESGWPKVGPIGIASQSGAYGAHMLSAAIGRDLGISAFVTTGNEADIATSDVIRWMVDDDGTQVIVAYLEGIKDGEKLVEALDAARAARKPVIVMKAGRSKLGSVAAQSHTASLAGNDAIADSVFRELGAIRIANTQEALDFAEAATRGIYPVANSLGVLTVSGGAGILIADDAERLHLDMPEMPETAQSEMLDMLSFAATRNPVDCTAQALNQLSLVGDFGIKMVREGGYKSLLVFFSQAGGAKSIVPGLREQLQLIRKAAPDCLCVLSVLASPEVVRMYQDDGYLVYDDPARAVAAIAAMGRIGQAFAREPGGPVPDALPDRPLSRTPNEAEAKVIFQQAGIRVAAERVVATAADARAAAAELAFPVVMKIVSPDIIHKTEIGGVLTGISNEDAAEEGFRMLMQRAAAARPEARVNGALVARQIVGGVECIMGVTRDPVFGPVAMFGLGGIFVEVLKDIVLRRCPFSPSEAFAMINSIKSIALLKGARGSAPVELDALAHSLSRLSMLACSLGPNLKSIDVNPVIATPDGAFAVDAVIEIEPNDTISKPLPESPDVTP